MTRSRGVPVIVLAAISVGMAAAVLHARDVQFPLPPSQARLLYLRSGRTANRLYLSFDALAADLYWIRTIQHYGRDVKSPRTDGRFELLAPLLDLTTTLDPRFNIAYRFGAIFLAEPPPKGPGRPDEAIALLKKGLARNPTRWQYAHDIGFVNYWYTGNYVEAARWFEQAAGLPQAPEWIRPLAALTLAEGGDRPSARRMLAELLTSGEGYIRAAAERGLRQLQALDGIDQVQALIEQYHAMTGSYPGRWSDMIRARVLPGIPADPTGTPFVLDAAAHTVSLSAESSLWPLPLFLMRKP